MRATNLAKPSVTGKWSDNSGVRIISSEEKAMSFSMLFYLASVMGAYKLGNYNQAHPGQLVQDAQKLWKWMNS